VVAIPDAGPFVERLRAGGHTEVAVLAPDVMVGVARQGSGATEALAEADVVVLAASRAWLTREVVELCDRAATRIVAWARDPSERRFAEVLGVAVVDADVDALDAVTALPSPRPRGRSRGRVIVV
jgi:hypothetical protein